MVFLRCSNVLNTYLGSLKVEGLGVVTEEHNVLFQVSQTPVFVVSDSILWTQTLVINCLVQTHTMKLFIFLGLKKSAQLGF